MSKLQVMIIGIITSVVAFYMFYYIRPGDSGYKIIVFIVLISISAGALSYRFLTRKLAILISIFVGSFFLMNYLAGFQLLNTLLLVSFIMGIGLLI